MLHGTRDNHQLLVDHILAHQGDFYRLAFSYVKNRDAALDVVQESIAKALAKSGSLRKPEYLSTWFTRILLNECMNYFRSGKRLVPFDEALEEPAGEHRDPGERLDLYDAIDRLGFGEQTVIRLRFFEDMKLEEIARATGVNLSTVKTRLYKALKRLKAMTGEELCDERANEARQSAV